ncbi:MAG: hypothetical protein IIA65_06335 [Planctomycetes bacterium]|nr:hypothetical protein [Planctomycetota bacterium]
MGSLNTEQRQLLLDHCIGVATHQQSEDARQLISSNPAAAKLVHLFEAALAPLATVEPEACPDALVEKTLGRLQEAVQADAVPIEPLSAEGPIRQSTIRIRSWRQAVHISAVAAILLFAFSIAWPTLQMARQRRYQTLCQGQLAGIYRGLTHYINDHDAPPTILTSAGEPWWKVGYQGVENHSNTRVVWLLVKNGYVEPSKFACAGRLKSKNPDFSLCRAQNLNDFPGREYIDYSFRISHRRASRVPRLRSVLMADLNPLCEMMPTDFSKSCRVRLDLSANSKNHQERGQNLLFTDGSVAFSETRVATWEENDDIYTLRSMTDGCDVNGCEIPASEDDVFLAP